MQLLGFHTNPTQPVDYPQHRIVGAHIQYIVIESKGEVFQSKSTKLLCVVQTHVLGVYNNQCQVNCVH